MSESTIDRFLVWLQGSRSEATVESYSYAFYSFRKYLEEIGKIPEQCTLDELSQYALWLENRGLKSGTRNLYLTAVRSLWRWMYRQGIVSFSEDMIPSPPAIDKESYPFLERDEFLTLMNACGSIYPHEIRNKALLSFLYATGVRIGELLSLNASDIDLSTRTGIVKTFKRKNHKREIYWDEDTSIHLTRWLDLRKILLEQDSIGCEALWISMDTARQKCRIGRYGIQTMIRTLRREVGMEKKITAHSFRHGFGHRGVKANANLRYLQVMMGHASLKTTTIYMGYKNKDVEEEYRRMMEQGVLTDRSGMDTMPAYAKSGKDTTKQRDVEAPKTGSFIQEDSSNIRHQGQYCL